MAGKSDKSAVPQIGDAYPRAAASFGDYAGRLARMLQSHDWSKVELLAEALRNAWQDDRQVFLCGNGGSAANALHIANDFLYGVAPKIAGMRVTALTSNVSVLTCLANDLGYEEIFSRQIKVHGRKGDILIALSGSGNSANIVKALMQAKEGGMKTFAIVAYSGGKCLTLADTAIHFAIDDMQIAEDLQLVVGHMLMQSLCAHPVERR